MLGSKLTVQHAAVLSRSSRARIMHTMRVQYTQCAHNTHNARIIGGRDKIDPLPSKPTLPASPDPASQIAHIIIMA